MIDPTGCEKSGLALRSHEQKGRMCRSPIKPQKLAQSARRVGEVVIFATERVGTRATNANKAAQALRLCASVESLGRGCAQSHYVGAWSKPSSAEHKERGIALANWQRKHSAANMGAQALRLCASVEPSAEGAKSFYRYERGSDVRLPPLGAWYYTGKQGAQALRRIH